MARSRGLSWRAKLGLLMAAFALIPLVVSTYYSLREQARSMRQQTLQRLEALVRAKAEAIDQFAEFRRRDAERMATLLAPFLLEMDSAKGHLPVEEPDPEQLPDLKDGEESLGPDRDRDGEPPEEGKAPTEHEEEPQSDDEPPPAEAASGDDAALRDEPSDESARPDPGPTPAGAGKPSPKVAEAVDRAEASIAATRDGLRRAVGLIAWDQEEYEEILVLDPQGRVIVSTFAGHEDHDAGQLRYYEMGTKGTYLEPVFLSPITGELTMVISTPIRDDNHALLGVLAARLNLKRFFRLLNDATGLGETGETVAGRVDGEDVLFMAPTRHRPDAALEVRIPLGNPVARPVREAARGNSGSGRESDYRGIEVLAAWSSIPSLDWGIVVKIDETEAMQTVEQARMAALLGAGVLVLLCTLAAFLVSQLFVRPLRDLREATERISRGDFEVSLEIRSGDEIGELADSFERMVAAIKFFREHSRSAEEEEDEVEAEEASGPAEPEKDP